MKQKKGIEQAVLVKLLGIIASFIVIAMLLHKVFDVTYAESAENVCRMSVISHAKTQMAGSPIMNLKCPRKFVTFDDDGYKIYYADELPIDKEKLSYKRKFKEDVSKKKQIYEVMADEMAECWYKMGKGELDLFEEDKWFTTKNTCNICAQIGFSKDFNKENELGTIGEFNEFLENHNFTKYGIDENYDDFIFKNYPSAFSLNHLAYFFKEDSMVSLFKEDTQFTSKKNYVVFFKGYKFGKVHSFIKWGSEKIKGDSLNRIFPNDRYFVYFSEQEDITKTCGMVVN